ncbi:MAG: exostosin family protein [Acidobacteriota bacterium]|nr:exostosin family protein [Acidobacteriota bacterium]
MQPTPRFFAYPFTTAEARFRWDYDRFFYDRWCKEAGAALDAHPWRTDDPREADFFVVTDTLRWLPFAGVDHESFLADSLLVHRGTGKPHVIFDFTDHPMPVIEAPGMIICKSAWHEAFYEPEHHVPIPQFPRYRFDRSHAKASERPYLAGFKGNPRPECADVRTELMTLDDDRRMMIKSGVFLPEHLQITEDGEAHEVPVSGEYSYTELIFNATFALLPRANGFALSYRMIESMNAGCVPVVISDGYILPFNDLLDYSSFSLHVPELQVQRLEAILEENLPRADTLQAESLRVFHTYFSSTAKIIHHTLVLAANRALPLTA